VSLGHRETPGASERETRGGLDLDARYKAGPDFRLDLEGGLRFSNRPGWLDEYQPTPTGLGPTDRYGHLDLRLGAAITAIPLRHQHLRVGLRYTHLDYVDDPAYNAVDAPTHLVPGDRSEVTLDVSWRHFGDGYKSTWPAATSSSAPTSATRSRPIASRATTRAAGCTPRFTCSRRRAS
jgi:hypothetical protein